MRLLGRILFECLFAASLLVLGLLLALRWVPSSSWARQFVRAELASTLGALGSNLELDEVSVHWFQPRVELRGLRLGLAGRDVRIERARAHLSWHLRWPLLDHKLFSLEGLELTGGRLRISHEWLQEFDTLREDRRAQAAAPPPILVSDLAVVLATEGSRDVPLGTARLHLRSDSRGRPRLSGELGLALGLQDIRPVRLEGTTESDGRFLLQAWGSDLALSQERLSAVLGEFKLPFSGFTGHLSLESSVRLGSEAGRPVEAQMRVRLERAGLDVGPENHLEQLALDLSMACRAPAAARLWASDGWSGTARASARWNGQEARSRVWLGRSAGPGWLLRANADLPELAIDASTIEALGQQERMRRHWEALEPRGRTSASVGLRLPWRDDWRAMAQGISQAEMVLDLQHVGNSGLTFHGWLDPEGRRRGIPIPVDHVRGRTLFVHHPGLRQPDRLALLDLNGEIQDAGQRRSVSCVGSIHAPLEGHLAELDLELSIPAIGLGETLAAGLRAMPDTAWIWDEFSPGQGSVSTHWRLRQGARMQGLAAAGDMQFTRASAAWAGLRVRLEDLSGSVAVRFDARATELRKDGLPVGSYRPVGVSFDLSGRLFTAEAVSVRGFLRGESTVASVLDEASRPKTPIQSISVELSKLSLTGQDIKDLARYEPAIGAQLEAFLPRGFANASWHGGRPAAGEPYRYEVQISTSGAGVQPKLTQTSIQEVAGRVLITSTEAQSDSAGASAPRAASLQTRIALAGTWAAGADVAMAARGLDPTTTEVLVYGTAVDPANPAVLGAFSRLAGSDTQGGLDLGGLELQGRLDFQGRIRLESGSATPPRGTYRVELRQNDLRWGDFGLGGVSGVLVQEGEVLSSEELRASLGNSPVVLRKVRFVRLEKRAHLPERDPLFDQPGFLPSGPGSLFVAELSAADLPIDREHLKAFFDPQKLDEVLARFGWSGRLSIEPARLVLAGDSKSGGKLALSGRVALRDMSINLGLPLFFQRAQLDLHSLVFERGRVRAWGEIQGAGGSLAGRPFEEAGMIVSYVDGRLSIDDLHSRFQGQAGHLSSLGGPEGGNAFAIDLGEPYHFALALELVGVKLEGLLQGLFESSLADEGTCNARVRLAGRFADVSDLQGSGSLELFDTRLWSIPVVRTLFAQLGSESTAVFDEMRMRFELRDGVIFMKPIVVSSKILRLEGTGRLDLDGSLRHDFEVRYSLVDKLGPFTRLLYWIQNNLLRVSVRGDMSRPLVILRSTLLDLFREREPRARHLPLPDYAPLSELF